MTQENNGGVNGGGSTAHCARDVEDVTVFWE